MAKQGYIKLYRQLQDCWIWCENEKFDRSHAWIDILLSCNHADKKIQFNGKPIVIERGQWLTSMSILSDRWGWSRHKVSDFLNALVNDNMLVVDKDNKRTLITVVNYDIFQGYDEENGQQMDNRRTSDGHQTDTNNNDKNDNNDNNIITTTVISLFNEICVSFPKVKKISNDRKKTIQARLKIYSLEEIEQAFRLAEQSDFMKGANDRNWIADFDWIMKDRNIAKVLEGKYNNRSEQKGVVNGTDKGNSSNGNEYDSEMLKTYGL